MHGSYSNRAATLAFRRRMPILLAAAIGLALLLASGADAFVYWTHDGNKIGRANTNGTGQNPNFIVGAPSSFPTGISLNSQRIHWANSGSGFNSIGRANLNGTGVNQSFITTGTLPAGTAVNGTHIFWTVALGNRIGRADIGGTNPNPNFITGTDVPSGIAINATDIYFSNQQAQQISRAPIGGGTPDFDFVQLPPGSNPSGVAVNATHVYWSNFSSGSIGRVELDGDNPAPSFIVGADRPCDITIHDGRLYWANSGFGADNGSIGRADIVGGTVTNIDQNFMSGAAVNDPCGIAVNSLAVPSCQARSATTGVEEPVAIALQCSTGGASRTFSIATQPQHGTISGFSAATGSLTYTPDDGYFGADSFRYRGSNAGASSNSATVNVTVTPNPNGFTIGDAERNKKKGTALLPVDVPGAGSLELSGEKIKDDAAEASGVGGIELLVKAKGKAKRKLKRKGKAKVSVEVTFSPNGGESSAEGAEVKLKRRK
jgi:virginiamycin B lyase